MGNAETYQRAHRVVAKIECNVVKVSAKCSKSVFLELVSYFKKIRCRGLILITLKYHSESSATSRNLFLRTNGVVGTQAMESGHFGLNPCFAITLCVTLDKLFPKASIYSVNSTSSNSNNNINNNNAKPDKVYDNLMC